MSEKSYIPGKPLLQAVRAGFVLQGTSLASWCKRHNITREWATQSLIGTADGPAATLLMRRIADASSETNAKLEQDPS